MSEFIILVLVVVVVAIIRSLRRGHRRASTSNAAKPQSVSVSVSVQPSGLTPGFSSSVPDIGHVRAVGDTGWWLLNPNSDAPMAVTGLNREQAEELKRLLDRGYSEGSYQHTQQITEFLLRTHARWGELEDYIDRARALCERSIAYQQRNSSEWKTAGERDQQDLLSEFRKAAIQSLDVRPCGDLMVLLEDVPDNEMLDDPLLEQYGIEALQLYLRYISSLNRVHIVPAESYERAGFEGLVQLGLARRGTEIPVEDILESCTLKTMNDLVTDLSVSPFRRKRPAIDYLVTLPDIQARLGSQVAFREIFQLLPLPERFGHIDLEKLAQRWRHKWRHTHEVADLMHRTYVFGGWAARNRANILSMAGTGPMYWTLDYVRDDVACPSCRRAAEVGYRQNVALRVPLHPGCRCGVNPRFELPPDSLKMSSVPPHCQLPAVPKPLSSPVQPHTDMPLVMFHTETIQARKLSQHGKARFALPDGFEGTVEEIALHQYQQAGWHGVWGENDLWWMVMALLFWDVYFADVVGAWDPLLKQTGLASDMPRDLFLPEFYERRQHLIADRMANLRTTDVCAELTASYTTRIGVPCRPIERWDKFPLEVLREIVSRLPCNLLLSVLQRLLENFNEHRRGLPDLLLWQDDRHVWAEVKGPGDAVSVPQQQWLSFLRDHGAETWIIRVVDSQSS